jgi:hypothetical protein
VFPYSAQKNACFKCALLIRSRFSVFGFRLAIQKTTNRHVSNAFDLIAVFISFPWRVAAAAAAAASAADF